MNGCNSDDATLYQVSLLQALALGNYNGIVSIDELKKHGDIGLGTFDGLDGEMIMLDGIVYKAKGDGSVEIIDEGTTPFANVVFSNDDIIKTIKAASMKLFNETMELILIDNGVNSPYFIKMNATFDRVVIRSIPKQTPPYRRLADVVSTDQVIWDHEEIKGTVVGLYCPSYMGMTNNVGWHLHFISNDRRIGGHVLDLSTSKAECRITKIGSVHTVIPDRTDFHSLDLSENQKKDIEKIEGTH